LKFKNEAQIKSALYTIGKLYLRIENYPAALNYYRQSLDNISKDDSLYQAKSEEDVWIQMEFAEIYCHLQQYDSALIQV
jgi:tetratricopeptide (TPR) repeat protein